MENSKFIAKIARFYDYFKNEQKATNKSKNTIISYNTTISSFIEFLKQYEKQVTFSNIKKMDILNFLEYKNDMLQKQTELKMTSKKLYVTHLKTFFSFIEENMEDDELTMKLSKIFKIDIKTPKRTPKGIEKSDVARIKDFLEQLKVTNLETARWSILLKLSLFSGARRGELAEIRVEDFIEDGDLYIINTIGKGSKERTLYIPKSMIEEALMYYQNNGYNNIAITENNRIMSGSEIYRFLNSLYKKIGINYSGVHILRHTFAKDMIARDVNITTIQQLLGHSNIQTTMIYTNPNQREIQKSYRYAMNLN
jgi:site-specific recombinase XerD